MFAVGLSLDLVQPFNSTFLERDLSLSKERLAASIPSWLLGILCAALPAALLLCLECASHVKQGGRGFPQPFLLLGLGLALASTMLATNALKNAIGSKRPNFFALCQYSGYQEALASRNASSAAWLAYEAATQLGAPGSLAKCAAAAADAQRSFPSGHSSLSFAGLAFLALALRASAGLGAGDWLSPAALAAGSPLALAMYIAATRVRENWHREVDVSVGALLGSTLALVAWHTVARLRGVAPPLCGDKPKPDEDSASLTQHPV
jgi:diacylglycerol diphosphate phosphatase/phosphatidate phosphatase